MYLAQVYMLTPAIAAIITRLFFYEPRFKDANLRFGKITDYLKYWFLSLVIISFSYVLFTLMGSVSWDFTGNTFIEQLTQQLGMTGQDINDTLPPGFTPQMMLLIYFIGGITVFNILPGIITGFGEEFGHRGFMFPLLYEVSPLVGIIGGGLIWYAWHLPLGLVVPQTVEYPASRHRCQGGILHPVAHQSHPSQFRLQRLSGQHFHDPPVGGPHRSSGSSQARL